MSATLMTGCIMDFTAGRPDGLPHGDTDIQDVSAGITF